MPRVKAICSGWRGICLVAITYVYFLIFAQFAFLKRLAMLGIADEHLKAVMGVMACGGILISLLAPRLRLFPWPNLRLRAGLAAAGLAAALSLLPLGLAASLAVSFLIGCGLGLLTVTLVTWLRLWLGSGYFLLKVGLGTGIGYLICNFPPFFTAMPETQATIAAALCVVGVCATSIDERHPLVDPVSAPASSLHFLPVLAGFIALIWLDSAAFFIIQNTPALKAGTWQGTVHLWVNGLLHFAAALASAWWLRRSGLPSLLAAAFLALASACILLLDPSGAILASVFYPVGVSLYSVALVAYPSLLAQASSDADRGRQAGWIYAIGGWFGSAMGIGMGQNLGCVPPGFVLLAGVIVLLPVLVDVVSRRRRELGVTAVVLASALCVDQAVVARYAPDRELSEVRRGRQVYIAEGCISCHSQYVRPNTPDTLLWGPVQRLEQLRREQPPLIGNRRQGPDLAEVGSRRSPLWFKAHLLNPSEVTPASFMPSYAYLFHDQRGADLVSYLQSLQGTGVDSSQHMLEEEAWGPSDAATANANANEGERLFHQYCATCHADAGPTRSRWQSSFRRLPPNLAHGPFLHLPAVRSTSERMVRLQRIVKFGIPGTDMPGHEYLPDQETAAVSFWIALKSTVDASR